MISHLSVSTGYRSVRQRSLSRFPRTAKADPAPGLSNKTLFDIQVNHRKTELRAPQAKRISAHSLHELVYKH